MGYETTLYIVEKYAFLRPADVTLVNGKTVHQVYNKTRYYLEDGNTKVEVKNPVTVSSYTCHMLAMIDMRKMGLSLGSICKFEESDVHCYRPDNGNAYLGLDGYGDYRKFVPLTTAIELMQEESKKDNYRRYKIALALMKSIKSAFKPNLENIGVLEYGY